MSRRFSVAVILALSFASLAPAEDQITTRDDRVLKGSIVDEDPGSITIRTKTGDVKVKRDDVLAIVRDGPGKVATPAAPAPAPKEPAGAPAKTETPSTTDAMPEATKLERDALVLEGRGKLVEALDSYEKAIEAALASSAPIKIVSARAEVYLRRLHFFYSKLELHERAVDRFKALMDDERMMDLERGYARWYRALHLRSTGKVAASNEEVKSLGFGTQWYVIGAFDNERGTGFAEAYGPEKSDFDPKATFDGKKRKVVWRPTTIQDPPLAEIDLDSIIRPNDQCLAYAVSYLNAESATSIALRIGSDEALKVWVNGRLLASEEKRRPIGLDQTVVGVKLAKGWNQVLLKVCDQTGGWGFRARVTALEGGAAPGVRWATLDEIASAPKFDKLADDAKLPTPFGGAVEVLQAAREKDPKDFTSRFHLGYLLYCNKPFDQGDHDDRKTLDEARQLHPDDPYAQVFYGYTAADEAEFSVNKEENAKRRAFERALEIDPGYAEAGVLLAGYYFRSLGNAFKARALVDRALKESPDYLDAVLLSLELDEQADLAPLAQRKTLELAKADATKKATGVIRRVAALDHARGDVVAAMKDEEALVAIDQNDLGARRAIAGYQRAQGKLDAALKTLEETQAYSPYDIGLRLERAGLQDGLGKLDATIALVEECLTVAPEDDGLEERLGRLLERAGKDVEARKHFDRALELNPNLVELKKYLEYLERAKAGQAPFEEPWTVDAAPVVAEARKKPVDASLQQRVLLRNVVTKVNRDGTSSTFTQEVIRAENDQGAKSLQRRQAWFYGGEQKLTFKRARLYRAKGDVEDAPIGEAPSWRGGDEEFAQALSHGVTFPPLDPGDAIEVQWRTDDLVQGFFGDYFGADQPFAEFDVPVDSMRFVILAPEEKKLYFNVAGLPDVKTREKKDDAKKEIAYVWEKTAIAKIETEPRMPWAKEVLPHVQASTFKDWDTFAKWYWGLVKKQQESNPEIKKKVEELTKDCKTDEEKIRKVYNFVVTDIRYNASWEFGVHGFKPYNATSIFTRKFGDCKDKATLINTMLADCGIKSYPVLIFGENPRGKEDLALPLMHHFNHCISYVPSAKGGAGMWLDGTAQYHPFDTLPTMDYGATTLIVTGEKALVKTIPFRAPDANLVEEKHEVKLKPDGSADVKSVFGGSGDFNWFYRESLATKGRRPEVLEAQIGKRYAGAKVKKVECSNLEDLDSPVKVEVEVTIPKLLERSTGGLALDELKSWAFSGLYLHGAKPSDMAAKSERQWDVVLPVPSGVEEEIVYELPPGHEVKSVPSPVKLDAPFGAYEKSYKVEAGKIHVKRTFKLGTNRIEKEKYGEFRTWVGQVERAENEKVILSKEGDSE